MYEKNPPSRANLTPEFEDGVTAFIEWQVLTCIYGRYKPTRDRNPNLTKTPYAVLRYLLITPRLQRLYASQATAEQMTWHANHQTEERSMCHQSDAELWRNFDRTYLDFAVEPRNVRLDMKELRLHGMKSHDCHVFMQKLITIAFREMLPEFVWSALLEVNLLFRIICLTTLDVVKVQELEDEVVTILCNLEKIFSPSFFGLMEHLTVHLPI
ncbi:UNVERIFIED_CONTAM: hypothetical protein Scaly_1171800 [Sesamum calycinum]|uniref:DUF4218 domain-containing protein n=1 Tax=Sesamum calycinum TaxID=2727403 RepID=A0AAW2Q336_9LAMI